MDTRGIAHRSTPAAIARWLAVLDQRIGAYRYRFTLKTVSSSNRAAYKLSVQTAAVSRKAEGTEWTHLHTASRLPDPSSALSFAVMLASYLPELSALQKRQWLTLEEDRLLFFLREATPVLNRLGAEILLPKELSRALRPRLTVTAKTKGAGNLESFLGLDKMLDYDWALAIGDQTFSPKEFSVMVERGKRVVRLKDGFLSLDPDEIRRLLERTRRPPEARDAVAAFLDGGAAFSVDARRACARLFREKKAALPSSLRAKLRPYQKNGYSWAFNNIVNGFGCLLADDMGLGKTVQAIGVICK